jgi:fumarate reductase subunit C
VNVRLYLLQRGSAAVMLPLVLLHLGIIFYASRHGLSAADILARTRGSLFWGTVYAAFVVAAATHAAIGVRVIAAEWTGLRGAALEVGMWSFGLLLATLGLIAVAAVVLA